jgi:general nucleoside transport system permease protein
MSEQTPGPDSPPEPEGPSVPAGPAVPAGPEPEPEAALAEIAASSPEDAEQPEGLGEPAQPEQPEGPPGDGAGRDGTGGWAPGERARIIRDAIMQGNSFTVTVLALLAALVVGGLINAFSNTTVLHAWGNLFSAPGHAFALAWSTAVGAYVELFEGSIFNPHTVSALFQQASIATAIHDGYLSAVFNPLSETCVQATPLILAGLAVALPYQAGLFNIGGQSQFIGGAIVATYLGYGISMPVVIHVVVCVLGSFAGGAAIGWFVGELKARTGAHEVSSRS